MIEMLRTIRIVSRRVYRAAQAVLRAFTEKTDFREWLNKYSLYSTRSSGHTGNWTAKRHASTHIGTRRVYRSLRD